LKNEEAKILGKVNDLMEAREKVRKILEERTKLVWEKRYYELKSYIVMLAIGLVLAWLMICLIILGVL
jgi:hypothetical protein